MTCTHPHESRLITSADDGTTPDGAVCRRCGADLHEYPDITATSLDQATVDLDTLDTLRRHAGLADSRSPTTKTGTARLRSLIARADRIEVAAAEFLLSRTRENARILERALTPVVTEDQP